MNIERKAFTIAWFIENYSYCWQKNGKAIISPEFTIDGLRGAVWKLKLYPKGCREEETDRISLFLTGEATGDSPEEFPLKIELSVLAADGSPLRSCQVQSTFRSGYGYGTANMFRTGELLLRKSDYLPNDTLNVCCKILRDEDSIKSVTHITARTRIGIAQISFLHAVEDFSLLEPNNKKIKRIKTHSKKGLALSSKLYFFDNPRFEGEIVAKIVPSGFYKTLTKCKISLIDSFGKAIKCGEVDNRFKTPQKKEKIHLSLTRQVMLEKKREYLPDDKLCLMYECVLTTGVEFEKIERILNDLPFEPSDQTRDKDLFAEKLSKCPSALEDYKEIYFNRLLCDVELKTKTKTFPAHKSVLCARSFVFQSMLTSDMKEKDTNCIQLDDLEAETVQKFLLFLYSDNLENLKWESVIKLYYAADKYAIEKLKLMCSSFLVLNISEYNAIELLQLADRHNDCDLKNLVKDFILEHKDEVYRLYEWEELIEINSRLVVETMLSKYKRLKIR